MTVKSLRPVMLLLSCGTIIKQKVQKEGLKVIIILSNLAIMRGGNQHYNIIFF
jgi:hypothetical protein